MRFQALPRNTSNAGIPEGIGGVTYLNNLDYLKQVGKLFRERFKVIQIFLAKPVCDFSTPSAVAIPLSQPVNYSD